MYSIKKFKERGYELKAENNQLIFEDSTKSRYIFDLTTRKVKTNIIMRSDNKEYENLIKQMKKELCWID